MDGTWLGYIQPMCSKPWHSLQGPFFCHVLPFLSKGIFGFVDDAKWVFYVKKGPSPNTSLLL